ncbi:GntR family transcriptional regulator/MocR family aminotransferase [Propionicimonas paludicola]|uniref:GntR family transcriptional regulator/MocR family aminotransferase n=2 Tax=Propionicimonas paludicola TaxID=185243 RepID=A0A2A9CQE1_9ACTN|nr:GntR family transcriptional regulator/MocR family aminotransferase [Propionicimonas paludicola]
MVAGDGPRHARLAMAIRTAIRDGQLSDGAPLPPSRELAAELSCSRWVVTQAYEQLVAEGYLEAHAGAGTKVRSAMARPPARAQKTTHSAPVRYDLGPGLPDLSAFPRAGWARAWHKALTEAPHSDLGYAPAGGHPALREALADYLGRVRGATVAPDNVIVTTGVREGVSAMARLLAGQHDRIAVEDPGWARLRATIASSGLQPVSLPVDRHGARTDELDDGLHLAALTPAHHFPTGAVLSSQRRADALAWAERVDGLLLEDDYDAEFRYDRRPIGTLQGLAPNRVALFGSVSKTLAPAVRIGWIAAPPQWSTRLTQTVPEVGVLDQLALARFLRSGSYDRYLRQARRRYRVRRDLLVSAIARRLPQCRVSGVAAGLHLLVVLPEQSSAAMVTAVAAEAGVRVMDLAACRLVPAHDRPTLVLGYGNLPDRMVDSAVMALATAIRTAAPG